MRKVSSLARSAASTEAAGVPPAAMMEPLHALAAAIDPEHEVKAGDLFWDAVRTGIYC